MRILDQSGNSVDPSAYTAYGETRSGGTSTSIDRRYTGQTLDQSTGLYWYSSRPYNPVLGRFTQPDTVVPDQKNPQALNRYSYGYNNPLKYVDPSGHDPQDWFGGAWHSQFAAEHGHSPTADDYAQRYFSKAQAAGWMHDTNGFTNPGYPGAADRITVEDWASAARAGMNFERNLAEARQLGVGLPDTGGFLGVFAKLNRPRPGQF